MSRTTAAATATDAPVRLEAEHVLEFPYTRSTGPVIGAFLGALRDRRVVGIRSRAGLVLVPPQEHDPETAEPLDELVAVGSAGVVVSWSWNPEPREGQPLDRPFAWVLVRLDGADTPMLHALDVASRDDVGTGMRVRIRWAEETRGHIADIACFEPDDPGAAPRPDSDPAAAAPDREPVTTVTTPVRLTYRYTPGVAQERFYRAVEQGLLRGRRCSACGKVYLPPRGCCSMCGAPFTAEDVEVDDRGTVVTFAVVNVPFANQQVDLPYAVAEVLWDGAHITQQYLLQGVPADDVRMGMRVRAHWKPAEEREPSLSNIAYVTPVDEPDVPYDSYAGYL